MIMMGRRGGPEQGTWLSNSPTEVVNVWESGSWCLYEEMKMERRKWNFFLWLGGGKVVEEEWKLDGEMAPP